MAEIEGGTDSDLIGLVRTIAFNGLKVLICYPGDDGEYYLEEIRKTIFQYSSRGQECFLVIYGRQPSDIIWKAYEFDDWGNWTEIKT